MLEAGATLRRREADRDLSLAYHVAVFERQKRLKKFSAYLAEIRPRRGQAPGEMIAALRAIQSKGAPMKIERINRGWEAD